MRRNAYLSKRNDKNTKKLKGISKSQSENIKFEGYYRCLFGGKYQNKSDNSLNQLIFHEMYLQKAAKNSLYSFDD